MKYIPIILLSAIIICGCTGEKKATLTDRQVLELAEKKLPPLPDGGGYFTSYRDGFWTVSFLKDIRSNSPSALTAVAVVNDSDKSVEIIKKP